MRRSLVALAAASIPLLANAQSVPPAGSTNATLEERLQRLEQRQTDLEQQLKAKDAEIEQLKKQQQASANPPVSPAPAAPAPGPTQAAAAGSAVPKQAAPGQPATAPGAPAAQPAPGEWVSGIEKGVETAAKEEPPATTEPYAEEAPTDLAPGVGLVLAKSQYGMVKLGLYTLFRAKDQEPANQIQYNHLGDPFQVNGIRDFQLHRILMPFTGWLYDPRFTYTVTVWTVNDTEQVRVIGAFQYKFTEQFNLGGGIGSMPGTRSLNYNHPFWFGHDRVMADEFFRSGFTSGVWATGNLLPDLFYRVMVGNNISTLGVSAAKNTRAFAYGGTMAWMPTTGEYGPSGAYDDFEMHDKLATRFGFSIVSSPGEDRASQPSASQPDTTQIRIADSQLLFATGALGPGVTVQKADYETRAIDASMKKEGWSIVTELYYRQLKEFMPALGSAPIPTGLTSITDRGFMVQTGFFPIPKTLELYASTSEVFPQEHLGFRRSNELILGTNWFWTHTRLQRVNFQVINVTRSATSSTFGYYTGGLTGWIITGDVSMMF